MTASVPSKLLLAYDGRVYGGMEICVLMLLQHLDIQRYAPHVLVSGYREQGYAAPERFIQGVKAIGVPLLQPAHPGWKPWISFIKEVFALRELLKCHGIRIVHIHATHPSAARKVTIAAKLAGVQAILRTEHLPPFLSSEQPRLKYMLKPFDHVTNTVITVSANDRREQIELLNRDQNKVTCVHNGIEIEKFTPTHTLCEAKQLIGLNPALPVIGAMGRLHEQKGLRHFIDAAALVIAEYGAAQFLIVGEGSLESTLKQQSVALGIERYVHFVGFQSDPRLYIEAMDIATMPSLYEGLPLSLLEYMAMEKACVVSDYPSFQEAIINGESGIIVKMGDHQALSKAFLELLRNPDTAIAIGKAARLRVLMEFDINVHTQKVMKLYDQALHG